MQIKKLAVVPLVGMVAALAAVAPSGASSHREAPLISQDPVADGTDLYAFKTPDAPDTVTFVANYIPLEEPAGGPNFHNFGDDVLYRINIDNDGDAVADKAFDFRFRTTIQNKDTFLYATGPITSLDDENFNIRQTYEVMEKDFDRRTTRTLKTFAQVPPANIGPRSTPNYDQLAQAAVTTLPGLPGAKVFAGPRDDPFFVDLGSVFDLGGLRPFNEAHLVKLDKEPGKDAVAGYNTHSIVLQVPTSAITANGENATDANSSNSIIGTWTDAYRRTNMIRNAAAGTQRSGGGYQKVSRLGMPLVNEVVVPLAFKDIWNGSEPKDDGRFAAKVLDPELAQLIPVLYPGVKVPPAPRNDIATVFLTGIKGLNQPANVKASEMIRINLAIAAKAFNAENPLGVIAGDNSGFPNGRRLGDDVTDVELRALAGGYVLTPDFNKSPNNVLGDGVNRNDKPFLTTFPYVASPHQGYANSKGVVADSAPQPAAGS